MTQLEKVQSFKLSFIAGVFALAFAFVLTTVAGPRAQAQTFGVIHNFTGGEDGANPRAGVSIRAGSLFGTARNGGAGKGAVFQVSRVGSTWITIPLSVFPNGGSNPVARVVFGPDGKPYGTTLNGANGPGVVFNLTVSPTICRTANCPLIEGVLHSFSGAPDGANPGGGDLAWDQAGNIFGTTINGGSGNAGTVYELTRFGNSWTETPIYAFSGPDGSNPGNGVVVDKNGNLLGIATQGGLGGAGAVFELRYVVGYGWIESLPYNFQGDSGANPIAGLLLDGSGNLYGATSGGGSGGGGTIFQLSPAGDAWTFKVLYSFSGTQECGPWATLSMDSAGSLYGTTFCDGANGLGSVFKLTNTGNGWTYTSLHDFTGGSDGGYPISGVTFDDNGNLYGTASTGGSQNVGVVWMITP